MNIYLLNIIVVLLIGMVSYKNKRTVLVIGAYRYDAKIVLAISVVFTLMFLEMGLRGDFAIDTVNYHTIFDMVKKGTYYTTNNIFMIQDAGFYYFLMNAVLFFSERYLVFLIVVASIIAYSYMKYMKDNSEIFWLSALLLFCGGSFYTGFNVMRQILAASLIALAYKYLFSREFLKYCLAVLLISTIHFSAIIMIPMYFVLTCVWKYDNTNNFTIVGIIVLCAILYVVAPAVIQYISQYIYAIYNNSSAAVITEGVGFLGTFKALVISGLIIVNGKYFDKRSVKDRVIYNGSIVYLLFAACGAKVFIIQRFTHYFVPCLLVAYPHIICRMQSRKRQQVFIALVAMLFVLSGINMVISPNYYFYWDNKSISWY